MAEEIQGLKVRIDELELEMEDKERELIGYLEKIEVLEDNVMRLEAMLPDDDPKKGKKGAPKDSKIHIELEDREKEIRELKNKMGFLRKEKIQLQKELDRRAREKNEASSVIRIEEKTTPIDDLVGDLQSKINKQRLLITKLKQKSMGSAEFNENIRLKDVELKELKAKVVEFEEKLKNASATKSEVKQASTITRGLTEELQNKLNKAKRQIDGLKEKLSKVKKGKKGPDLADDSKLDELKEKIDELRDELDKKINQIEQLKDRIAELEGPDHVESGTGPTDATISSLTEELQTKLNKARIQIKSLSEEVKNYKAGKVSPGETNEKIEELEAELDNIKNIATDSQLKCQELESKLNSKEVEIQELKKEVFKQEKEPGSQEAGPEDPRLGLRVRELKNFLDDLMKQNIQQRIEITDLRKS